jgi:hypothetical protein
MVYQDRLGTGVSTVRENLHFDQKRMFAFYRTRVCAFLNGGFLSPSLKVRKRILRIDHFSALNLNWSPFSHAVG